MFLTSNTQQLTIEKMHQDHKIKQMTERLSEDFVLQLVMVIMIFIPLGFAGRLLSSYIIGGNLFLSSLNAIVGTLLSLIIFFTLSRYVRFSLTLTVGLLSNIVLLLSLYLLVWGSRTFTLKYAGIYLFRDGYVTIEGVVHYFPLALWDSIISCLDFVIYSKLYGMVAGSRRSALSMIALLALIPNMALARSTDQQANKAYELVSSGCVAVNNETPFFKGPPDSVSRTVADDSVREKRQYNNSQVLTLFGYGKLFIEQLTVSADSVPDELKPVFALSLFEFLSRYGVGERRDAGEFFYGDGLAGLVVRFEKKRLAELKWTCDRD